MGKVKQWSVEKKDAIEKMLIDMWASLGMDIPSNYEDIVQYCYEDVCETADPENWHSGDVAIAFRRWIEEQTKEVTGKFCPEPIYFHVIASGWNGNTQRQEVEINCGENGKLLIVKTNEGFVVDAYGQNDLVDTMAVWEEDMNPSDDDLLEESNAPENFSDVELTDFKDNWGQTHNEICSCLGYDPNDDGSNEMLLGDGYFWLDDEERWYPECSSMYSEREQAIADYLRLC